MDRRIASMRVLEDELQAQVMLLHTCAGAAVAARDPRLKSAWIGAIVV
jgi:hypothetical protein